MTESFGEALRRLRGKQSTHAVGQLSGYSKSYISALENGSRPPTGQIAATLDTVLDAQGQLIALAGGNQKGSVLDQADALQRELHEILAAGPLSDRSLDEVEWTVERHGRATRYRPEAELLVDLVGDFSALRLLLSGRPAELRRRRLAIAAARMSGLVALTLLKLGDDRASSWWRTGRAAAAAAGDHETLAWIYAQEAYQLYYSGDLHGAIDVARHAQNLAASRPCVGSALAAPLEARAHARLGQRDDTAAALDRSRTALDRLPDATKTASAFGYDEAQFAFHAGDAWTHAGDPAQAAVELTRALDLYPRSDHTDRTLVRLDQAECMAILGEPEEAEKQVRSAIVELPQQHRTTLIQSRARDVAARVPTQTLELRDLFALPPE